MFYISREFVIPASSDKILKFLEVDNRILPSGYYFSDARDFRADYRCRGDGNEISVYRYAYFTPSGKLAPRNYLDDPNGPGYEVIRFEVTQFFDNRSNVKGMYESFDPETDDPDIRKMFLTMIVRLAASSGAESLAASTQGELNELLDEITRKSGKHWGFTEWKDGPTPGSKMRALALIPNNSLPDKGDKEQEGKNNLEPWKSSRPSKKQRDKIIWELREAGETWEKIAEKADCGTSTAKENYERMKQNTKRSG
jgi:hypothetical protein